jgi:hypothetical protein
MLTFLKVNAFKISQWILKTVGAGTQDWFGINVEFLTGAFGKVLS